MDIVDRRRFRPGVSEPDGGRVDAGRVEGGGREDGDVDLPVVFRVDHVRTIARFDVDRDDGRLVLDHVPVAEGAEEAEAIGGGEDYELLIATDAPDELLKAFAAKGLSLPIAIGKVSADPAVRTWRNEPFEVSGYQHRL